MDDHNHNFDLSHPVAGRAFQESAAAVSDAGDSTDAPARDAKDPGLLHWIAAVEKVAEGIVADHTQGDGNIDEAGLFNALLKLTGEPENLFTRRFAAPRGLSHGDRLSMLREATHQVIADCKAKPSLHSDQELADRVARRNLDDLLYVDGVGWLSFEGHVWRPKADLTAQRRIEGVCAEAGAEAEKMDAKTRPCTPTKLNSSNTVRAVSQLAKSRLILPDGRKLDEGLVLLNTPAGVIDLRTDSAPRPQRRSGLAGDFITKSTLVVPAETSNCRMWSSFLDRVFEGDRDLIDFLQRFCGYCLTGETKEHIMLFLHGSGGNGKGVFTETIADILGSYACNTPSRVFMASRNDRHPEEVARLAGVRLVRCGEVDEGRRWNEGLLKEVTGGDQVTARKLYQNSFDFTPQCKLMFSGNHRPELRTVDEAIRRRFRLVPFQVTIPREQQDPELRVKLKSEYPAILRWMIEGCLAWHSEKGLPNPTAIVNATSDYFETEDDIFNWYSERCDSDPNASEQSTTLYRDYCDWIRPSTPKSQKQFAVDLLNKFNLEKHRTAGAIFYRGIKLKA